jgi:hypothetical protein
LCIFWSDVLLDDPCAANATDDNAMRKTVANDRIRFMVYLFSLRFEDDARALTPRSPKETQGERALFPTEDRRRDHFPVLCCMRAERHLASMPQGSGAEHVAISVRQCPQLNWIVDPPPRVYGTHVNVRFGSLADIGEGYQGCPLYPQKRTCSSSASMSAMCH